MVRGHGLTRNHRNFQYTNKRILENDSMAPRCSLHGVETVGKICFVLSVEHEAPEYQANQHSAHCGEKPSSTHGQLLLPLASYYRATALTPVVSIEALTA